MYYENQYIITYLATVGGIDDTQTTGIKLQSVAGVLTDRPGILIVDYADPLDETRCEWISYTSIDVNQELVGATRGVEKGSAKIHSQNAVIAFPHSKSNNNQFADIFHPAATTTIAENLLLKETAAAPTTPSAGYKKIYMDTDDKLYTVDDAGVAKQILQTGDVALPTVTRTRVEMSTSQSYLTASGDVKVNFDTEVFDTGSEYNTTSKKWIASQNGYAEIIFQVSSSTNFNNYYQLYVYVNGARSNKLRVYGGSSGVYPPSMRMTSVIAVTAGDELEAYVQVGVNITINGANSGASFMCINGYYG